MDVTRPSEDTRDTNTRVGLALSGGGFRASFFHLGVLARMAELRLLRQVEVISTVSGGSIIGALYYLHVKRLLENTDNSAITDEDYVRIVRRLGKDFLEGVEQNLRMRAFANPLKNLRMSLANYSRSDRMGELYERYFYQTFSETGGDKPIRMRDLLIAPAGVPKAQTHFKPLRMNAGLRAKVPVLMINATTLNSGHNWRFEADTMGEPGRPAHVNLEVDKNLRLARPDSYDEITEKKRYVPLGIAVAASACVPVIFHPLAISDVYPEVRVQLVDGGVHDNQGVAGLVDRQCTDFIVSDASGQMPDDHDPKTGVIPVGFRSNSVLTDRVREEELIALKQRCPERVALMHLQTGVTPPIVGWIDQSGKERILDVWQPGIDRTSEEFGVPQRIQKLLSRIRTDLDSFTQIEAYSLMLDGYLMSDWVFANTDGTKRLIEKEHSEEKRSAADPTRWEFGLIQPWFHAPTKRFEQHLRAGSRSLFKVLVLSGMARAFALGILVVIGLGGWAVWQNWTWLRDEIDSILHLTVADLIPVFWGFVVAAIVLSVPTMSRFFQIWRFIRRPSEFLVRLVVRAIPSAVASIVIGVNLWPFNRLFVESGRVRKLPRPEGTPKAD